MSVVYVVGTCDTKGVELDYVRSRLRRIGVPAMLVDVSTRPSDLAAAQPDVTASDVAACHPGRDAAVFQAGDRGSAILAMTEALTAFLLMRDDLAGVIGIGGSGNTALVTGAMRRLPIGLPKIMVSTVASGNVAPYVGTTDIMMLYSIVDIAGLNRISRLILGRAAGAMAGMVRQAAMAAALPDEEVMRRGAGMTMFGVTTPCVDQLRERLEGDWECFVFHATGMGGQTLEMLVESRLIDAVLDITTTEVADHLVGGVFPCSDDRFSAIARTKAPYVGSCGALDMVNFGARDTVPPRFERRDFYFHNPQVTLMRTTAEENRRFGEWIASRLNLCDGPVRFLLPEGGVSAIDRPGMAFHDPEADAALFSSLEENLEQTIDRRLIRVPYHINDPEFADVAAALFNEITSREAADAPH